jgi:hypothetical protein
MNLSIFPGETLANKIKAAKFEVNIKLISEIQCKNLTDPLFGILE